MFTLTEKDISNLEKLKNKEILITGGSGFIGTWLTQLLIFLNDTYNFNITLYLIARHITSNLEVLVNNRKDIIFIKNDIRNVREFSKDIAYIIHAASSPDNRIYMSNPIESMNIITDGTKNSMENALLLEKLEKIVHLGSGQVYGSLDSHNITENDFGKLNCNSISTIYPEAKRYAETLTNAYRSLYKLPIVQVRPFSFIGPYMSLNKPWAVNSFIRDALKTKNIRILGNGKPVRSYMYPTDMALWILNMLIHGKSGAAYNLGSDMGISLEEVAVKIKNIIGSSLSIEILNMNDHCSEFVPNINYVKQDLGLEIRVDIDDALNKSIKWFEKNLV
ncbi:NAD-dependent epimerase/dehydratase family protein [Sulfurospirillum halorespirans]|uniref:Putative nucleoside-diphosphate-sugar epimerase n=1 Tax=Sulfurospirillum halorespirans DSM 13726 TaxID=1193502 RepID=A0A1D7TLV7_9BACT|nr:NAD-dependent epimerase/dehydratase family protein [Sulfurospirillum halorespirans]AOO65983.1 putative nucleoside-diphosphate-sugar epimerase [Sulfurospirillum halorespirans DSM 13726]